MLHKEAVWPVAVILEEHMQMLHKEAVWPVAVILEEHMQILIA